MNFFRNFNLRAIVDFLTLITWVRKLTFDFWIFAKIKSCESFRDKNFFWKIPFVQGKKWRQFKLGKTKLKADFVFDRELENADVEEELLSTGEDAENIGEPYLITDFS